MTQGLEHLDDNCTGTWMKVGNRIICSVCQNEVVFTKVLRDAAMAENTIARFAMQMTQEGRKFL